MKFLRPILSFILFWLLLFNFQRLLFSFHYFSRIQKEAGGEYLALFWHSLRLDFSTIGFFALATLPFYLFFLLAYGKTKKVAFQVLKFQQIFILLIVALIHCGEINVYAEWNHKLSTRVFVHLTHPDEVFRTASISNYIYFFLYLAIELLVGLFLLKKLYSFDWKTSLQGWKNAVVSILFFIVVGLFSFLTARGGWQPIPITINAAIFSHSPIINDITVNSTYFFGDNLILYQELDLDKYLNQTDAHEAEQFADSLLSYPKEHQNYFLANKKPNVVFIVLESWAAEAISYSGLCKGSTPHFDSLIKQGVYFDRFYSGSGTSEIGNSGIFGGIPALPQVSITLYPNKSRKLFSINQLLKPAGYKSGYLFGGDLDYGNIGGFFLDHGFDQVEDEKVFPSALVRGKLNVYDPDLYAYFLKNINKSKQPFIQCVFTGSTHAPYDIPSKWQGFWKGEESGFMDGLHYSDQALFDFLEKCKKEPWFDNTLFIMVADHGRSTPTNPYHYTSNFFRVPLLFWGKPIDDAYRGRVVHTIGSHSDLIATLLYQMGIKSDTATWSKDLMNPNVPQFAMYSSTLGYGYLDSLGEFFYHMDSKQFEINTFEKSLQAEKLKTCRLYLKAIWDKFKLL